MKPTPKKRGRPSLAASVVRLEIRVPELLARMAEERAESRGITTAELWREAMHAHLGFLSRFPIPPKPQPPKREFQCRRCQRIFPHAGNATRGRLCAECKPLGQPRETT